MGVKSAVITTDKLEQKGVSVMAAASLILSVKERLAAKQVCFFYVWLQTHQNVIPTKVFLFIKFFLFSLLQKLNNPDERTLPQMLFEAESQAHRLKAQQQETAAKKASDIASVEEAKRKAEAAALVFRAEQQEVSF